MWYAKMYFSGEREFFENDAFGMQGLPSKQLELPFLESLLTFLELDEKEITPMLERISVNWEHFVESSDLGAHTAAMVELGMLAEKHIYFRVFKVGVLAALRGGLRYAGALCLLLGHSRLRVGKAVAAAPVRAWSAHGAGG